MKKILKYTLLIILSFSLVLLKVNATMYYSNGPYSIKSYNIEMNVKEDNKIDIKEKILVDFDKPKHGIKRFIPIKNEIIRDDGTTEFKRANIKLRNVNKEYKTDIENGNYIITIGDKDVLVDGEIEYLIDYEYSLRKDKNNSFDELYFNLIGNKWDASYIGDINFKITMPKEFDESKIGFKVGNELTEYNPDYINYNIDGKTISGKYNGALPGYTSLSIRIELPEGYFKSNSIITSEVIFNILLTIIGLGLATYIWLKYTKEESMIKTEEFYPPEDINILDLKFVYKKSVNSEDVSVLLLVLASKGYIKISEFKDSTNPRYKIEKLKEYDGTDEYEKLFMEGMFNKKDKHFKEVTDKDLKKYFYKTIHKIERKANRVENYDNYFKIKKENKYLYYIMIIILGITIAYPTFKYSRDLFPLEAVLLVMASTWIYSVAGSNSTKMTMILTDIGVGLVLSLATIIIFILSVGGDTIIMLPVILGLTSIFIIPYYRYTSIKRTETGFKLYNKIINFKNTLENLTEEKLQELLKEDSNYFCIVLPYTYILGITDKWIKKFKTISIPDLKWLEFEEPIDYNNFRIMFRSNMPLMMSNIGKNNRTSSGSSTSSISSSSSGFSGGGSGGGGGTSW